MNKILTDILKTIPIVKKVEDALTDIRQRISRNPLIVWRNSLFETIMEAYKSPDNPPTLLTIFKLLGSHKLLSLEQCAALEQIASTQLEQGSDNNKQEYKNEISKEFSKKLLEFYKSRDDSITSKDLLVALRSYINDPITFAALLAEDRKKGVKKRTEKAKSSPTSRLALPQPEEPKSQTDLSSAPKISKSKK